jgi:ATP-dependent Lon protease
MWKKAAAATVVLALIAPAPAGAAAARALLTPVAPLVGPLALPSPALEVPAAPLVTTLASAAPMVAAPVVAQLAAAGFGRPLSERATNLEQASSLLFDAGRGHAEVANDEGVQGKLGRGAALLAALAAPKLALASGAVPGHPAAASATQWSGYVTLLSCIVAGLMLIRWIEGSVSFQHYLARRRWATASNKRWRDAVEWERDDVLHEAETVVANNRTGRAESLADVGRSLRGMGRLFLPWRWPRYFREFRESRDAVVLEQAKKRQEAERSALAKDDPKALRERIMAAGMSDEAMGVALEELRKVERTSKMLPEYSNRIDYIEWLLSLPWNVRTTDRIDLDEARRIMDEDHSGLEQVKERIIEYLAVRRRTGTLKGPILCFVGPPGVGKTSIAEDIARTLGRKFVRLSLGGVTDEAEIRGHRRTYTGSLPGAVMTKMKLAGSKNPVFLLDEVDKLGDSSNHGSPKAALLELLDPEQNNTFRDRYLDVGFDMSEVLFIVTANDLAGIPGPLRDRLEIIEYSSYTLAQKIEIARNHLIPDKQKENGLAQQSIAVTDGAIAKIVEGYTAEAGVRGLGKRFGALMRKLAARIEMGGDAGPRTVDAAQVEEILGVPPFELSRTVDNGDGVASGLYVSGLGGGVVNVIVRTPDGKGQIILREMMGKMMRDSAKNVMSYMKDVKVLESLGLPQDKFRHLDVDITFTPAIEDINGPSAGVVMAVALASRLTGRAVRSGVAMTGEITPDGRVLPIGGLKEKVLAAHRKGYKKVLFPAANRKDAADIPAEILGEIEIVAIETMNEAFTLALEPAAK